MSLDDGTVRLSWNVANYQSTLHKIPDEEAPIYTASAASSNAYVNAARKHR